ncbi:hypothetical protein QA640_23030 [Bradyrhizobium sp. CB82]|uniref:hypothetical protein n=1 Tax=Bradyrhizobium sp. CB82 TaxID=3039159 RepID=UPI0024B0A0DF|nr:hypothetical protein [Bradyrhizobium sp. CB82]WFU37367.1 hypothetical protein QA640_23030 [Bradyrhizobium sp. CB82]
MATDEANAKLAAHLQDTFDIASQYVDAAGSDPHVAFVKAIGVLAGVLYICAHEADREAKIAEAADLLRDHIKVLDEVAGFGAEMH